MTAGSGVLHKEYHENEFSKKGGIFEMVQLWVNLPAAHKMTTPRYQHLTHETIPSYLIPNNGGEVKIIAGSFNGAEGAAKVFSELNVYNAYLNQNADLNLTFESSYTTAILILDGTITINQNEIVQQNNLVIFKNEGTSINLSCTQKATCLILNGKPLNEPIAAYGPFVMNTFEQINEAIVDYNAGKFGSLN
jgi:redox-sensitive bicupin YhaK (pirin superfamily)